jgi:pseudaminic acid synthase
MNDGIRIGTRLVGAGEPTFIIAELSANHGQDFEIAKRSVLAAKEAGADAIKLQTYTPDTLTIDVDSPIFKVGGGTVWDGRKLHDLYKEAMTPWEWHKDLMEYAHSLGLVFFSTPFDFTAVDFLEELNVPLHKIASFEMVDLPLIRYVSATGKPAIMSTGMATLGEIEEAVTAFKSTGNQNLILLKCTSSYPAPFEESNLRTIEHLAKTFGVSAGLSDHTMGTTVPVVAVALGACVIEKHFILSRDMGGPDSGFSLEPAEFKSMVEAVRIAEMAMGKVSYEVTPKQKSGLAFRRSLFVVADMKDGEEFTTLNLRSIRPSNGLHTRYFEDVLGAKATRDIKRGEPLAWNMVNR